jgi:predicted transcriptional regulator
MDALYRLRRATVAELVDAVPEPVTYSAVRAVLRTLREKGHVTYREDGPRYVYRPSAPRAAARARALQHLVRTFFDGSAGAAALALLDRSDLHLTEAELRALDETIERAARRRTTPPRSAAPHGPSEQDRSRRGRVARHRGHRGTATRESPGGAGYGGAGEG